MRRRLEGQAHKPEEMGEEAGLRWLFAQLAEVSDEARDVGDTQGALAALRTLAILAGHMEQRGAPGRLRDINVSFAAMIQRLDQEEEQGEPTLGRRPERCRGARFRLLSQAGTVVARARAQAQKREALSVYRAGGRRSLPARVDIGPRPVQ
jgi:hypothetical protein